MKFSFLQTVVACGLVVTSCLYVLEPNLSNGAQPAADADGKAVAVESDMHEFMEYYFQPTYLRLQKQMTAAPADNQGWKAIKSDALILAEGGNLLFERVPEKGAQQWLQLSVQVRELAGQVYQAGKVKNFKAARANYEAMLTKCNACHQEFAKGEHQLKP